MKPRYVIGIPGTSRILIFQFDEKSGSYLCDPAITECQITSDQLSVNLNNAFSTMFNFNVFHVQNSNLQMLPRDMYILMVYGLAVELPVPLIETQVSHQPQLNKNNLCVTLKDKSGAIVLNFEKSDKDYICTIESEKKLKKIRHFINSNLQPHSLSCDLITKVFNKPQFIIYNIRLKDLFAYAKQKNSLLSVQQSFGGSNTPVNSTATSSTSSSTEFLPPPYSAVSSSTSVSTEVLLPSAQAEDSHLNDELLAEGEVPNLSLVSTEETQVGIDQTDCELLNKLESYLSHPTETYYQQDKENFSSEEIQAQEVPQVYFQESIATENTSFLESASEFDLPPIFSSTPSVSLPPEGSFNQTISQSGYGLFSPENQKKCEKIPSFSPKISISIEKKVLSFTRETLPNGELGNYFTAVISESNFKDINKIILAKKLDPVCYSLLCNILKVKYKYQFCISYPLIESLIRQIKASPQRGISVTEDYQTNNDSLQASNDLNNLGQQPPSKKRKKK